MVSGSIRPHLLAPGLVLGLCSVMFTPAGAIDRNGLELVHESRVHPTAPFLRSGPYGNHRWTANSVEDAIEQCVEADMAAIDAPGAAVTVIHHGNVIFNRGFGYKRRGDPQLVDAETRFRIGSVTKMLTAAALMQQVDAGLVDLDDPVTAWIPELNPSGQWPVDRITVGHLLTHTSAWPDHYENPLVFTGDQALADWAASLEETRLHTPPGTFWNYSNPGFSLAGLVAERSGGLPYRELVTTRVFAPLGMDATTFDPAEVIASANYSFGHHPSTDGLETVYAPDDYQSRIGDPAGQAFSTAEDVASWALTLMDGGEGVLSPASAEAMQARQVSLELFPDYDYGLGIFAEKHKGLDVRQHGGNIFGWGAWLMWVPDERFVVSILGNTTYYLRAAAYCIVDAVLEPVSTDPPDYSTDPATWVSYTGSYEFMDNKGDFFQANVELQGDRLFAVFPNPIDPLSPTRKELTQLYLDTFSMEAFDEGGRDFELTFLNRGTTGSQRMWLRNQWFVGLRIPPPRHSGGRLAPVGLASDLQEALDRELDAHHGVGASATVITPGDRRWNGASGTSDGSVSTTPAMLFGIASITKTFVATVVLQLAEEDRLSLDDPIDLWLPTMPNVDGTATIRQLLNHTSGVFDFAEHPGYVHAISSEPTRHWTPQETIAEFVLQPYAAPGELFHYSNTGYLLLGLIIERASGTQVSTQIRSRILDPLDLGNTFFAVEEMVAGEIAHPWADLDFDGVLEDISYAPRTSGESTAWASGALYSTAGDVALFLRALIHGELLEVSSLGQMMNFVPATSGVRYGLGLQEIPDFVDGQPGVGHDGGTYGYTARMIELPGRNVSIAVLLNHSSANPADDYQTIDSISRALAQVALNSQ